MSSCSSFFLCMWNDEGSQCRRLAITRANWALNPFVLAISLETLQSQYDFPILGWKYQNCTQFKEVSAVCLASRKAMQSRVDQLVKSLALRLETEIICNMKGRHFMNSICHTFECIPPTTVYLSYLVVLFNQHTVCMLLMYSTVY